MLHLHTIVKRLVYLLILTACVLGVQATFAQERINFLAFNGELLDDLGPYYFRAQGNTQDAYVRVDLLAEKLGYIYSYDGQAVKLANSYRTIELKATNDVVAGLQKRSDALSTNGGFIASPMGIIVNDLPYAAISPMLQAAGGETGWRGEERLVWIHYDPSVDIPKPEPASESVQPNAPPVQTQTTGATLGSPRIGLQEGGQTRVVIDLPPNSFYEVYAYDKTLLVSLSQLGAAPFSQDFADDPNVESVRYALVDNKLVLVVTTRYALNEAGSGFNFALLPVDETTGNERFYVDFAPTLQAKAVKSAQGMQPSVLAAAVAQAPGAQQKVVLIDPGHGGKDGGTASAYATEKTVVLSISLKVKAYLEASGIQVQLTRSDDTYPELEERANAATPDVNLFVSIHANAAPALGANGIETWIFGEPLNQEMIAQAVRENGEGQEGQDRTEEALNAAQGVTGAILRETQLAYSNSLAELVQGKMVAATGAKDRGVRRNAFYVIRKARSPAILIETGFVSNAEEGPRLATDAYQDTLARAIAEGIVQFLNQGTLAANQQQP
jgi:N-acetylmuramoyl-L-alanine amidase